MEWYTGGVGEAISKCRREQALFIVYIQDRAQAAASDVWDDPEILSVTQANKFVALKVFRDSIEHRQFSQLYPVFVVPSVFCIGRRGSVLEMVSGPMEVRELKEKLQRAFEKLGTEVVPQTTPLADAAGGASPSIGGEDKAKASYQQKIEEKRREKAEEEIQKEKDQELKRREDMKSLAKVKEQQEQLKMQNWLSERAKEKELAKRAKDEVRAKVEMDRRERQGSPSNSSVEAGGGGLLPGGGAMRQRAPVTTASPPSPQSGTSTPDSCRVQLRLPADRTVVMVMKCSDTVAAMRRLVAQDLGVGEDKVLLSTVYPRRDLTSEMDSQTMLELQLVPSGVILVRVKGGITITPGGGAGGGVASSLWSALIGLFHLLLSLFAFLRKALGRVVSGGSVPASSPPARTQRRASPGDKRVRRFRQEDYQEGPDDEEDEEERRRRGTYNGNSTQQQ